MREIQEEYRALQRATYDEDYSVDMPGLRQFDELDDFTAQMLDLVPETKEMVEAGLEWAARNPRRYSLRTIQNRLMYGRPLTGLPTVDAALTKAAQRAPSREAITQWVMNYLGTRPSVGRLETTYLGGDMKLDNPLSVVRAIHQARESGHPLYSLAGMAAGAGARAAGPDLRRLVRGEFTSVASPHRKLFRIFMDAKESGDPDLLDEASRIVLAGMEKLSRGEPAIFRWQGKNYKIEPTPFAVAWAKANPDQRILMRAGDADREVKGVSMDFQTEEGQYSHMPILDHPSDPGKSTEQRGFLTGHVPSDFAAGSSALGYRQKEPAILIQGVPMTSEVYIIPVRDSEGRLTAYSRIPKDQAALLGARQTPDPEVVETMIRSGISFEEATEMARSVPLIGATDKPFKSYHGAEFEEGIANPLGQADYWGTNPRYVQGGMASLPGQKVVRIYYGENLEYPSLDQILQANLLGALDTITGRVGKDSKPVRTKKEPNLDPDEVLNRHSPEEWEFIDRAQMEFPGGDELGLKVIAEREKLMALRSEPQIDPTLAENLKSKFTMLTDIPQKLGWSQDIVQSLTPEHWKILSGPESTAKKRIVDQIMYETRAEQPDELLREIGDQWAEDILDIRESQGTLGTDLSSFRTDIEADIAFGREVNRQEELRYQELKSEQRSGIHLGEEGFQRWHEEPERFDLWDDIDFKGKYNWTGPQLVDISTPELRILADKSSPHRAKLIEKMEMERRASLSNAELRELADQGDSLALEVLDLRARTGALSREYGISHSRALDEVRDIYHLRGMRRTYDGPYGLGQVGRIARDSSARAENGTGRNGDSLARSTYLDLVSRKYLTPENMGRLDASRLDLESGRLDTGRLDVESSRLDSSRLDLEGSRLDVGRLDVESSRLDTDRLGPTVERPIGIDRSIVSYKGGDRLVSDLTSLEYELSGRPELAEVARIGRPVGTIPIETENILEIVGKPQLIPGFLEIPEYTSPEDIPETLPSPVPRVPVRTPPVSPPETLVIPETLPPAVPPPLPPGRPPGGPPRRGSDPMELDSEWDEEYLGDALIKEVEGDSIIYYIAGSSVKWGPYDRNALVRSRRLSNHERNRLYQEYLGDFGIEDAGVWELAHVLKATGKSRSLTQAENVIRSLLDRNPTRMLRDKRVAV